MTSSMERDAALSLAERALAGNNYPEALRNLWRVSENARAIDPIFVRSLNLFARCFTALEKPRAAASVQLFVQSNQSLQTAEAGKDPRDVARVYAAQQRHSEAAEAFARADWFGHAALQLEAAKNDRGALALWQRLLEKGRLDNDLYTRALVLFNASRASHRLSDATNARRSMIESMRLLEAAADQFEARNLRERAFDCYQVLLTIGRDGAFENLAEGYLNSIRILKHDHLKYYVLQYYEDFHAEALKRGEHQAAATIAREASDFCYRNRLPYTAYYKEKAANAYLDAARDAEQRGAQAQMIENSYAAAIDMFGDLGASTRIRALFETMAMLPLSEKRRARYARLSERYAQAKDTTPRIAPLPAQLKKSAVYPDVWRLDVIEWEQDGDAGETLGEVAFDAQWPEITRARALLCRLYAQSALSDTPTPQELEKLAAYLGRTEVYVALSPLERLFEHSDARVRTSVVSALQQLYFKRSFTTILRALDDSGKSVQNEAEKAVAKLHFTHAFDALARIYRTSTNRKVRDTALESIGHIQSIEAVDFLIAALIQGDSSGSKLAHTLLVRAEHSETRNILQRSADEESDEARALLLAVINARGAR